jgi:hypothetical protein
MKRTRVDRDDVEILAEMAARQNLTARQFILFFELTEDLKVHGEGNIQLLGWQKTDWGFEATLYGQKARYSVLLIRKPDKRCRLKSVREGYGERAKVIHESSDRVAGWECLRARILLIEGYESETQKQFGFIKTKYDRGGNV